MLKVADEKLHGRVELVLGDSEHLPFPDGSFDVVYCNDSFHHYPAPEHVLAEVRRVLRRTVRLSCDSWHAGAGRMVSHLYFKFSRSGDVNSTRARDYCAVLKILSKRALGKIDGHSTWPGAKIILPQE